MKLACAHTGIAASDWHETLHAAIELAMPIHFNVESLIDNFERGKWSRR